MNGADGSTALPSTVQMKNRKKKQLNSGSENSSYGPLLVPLWNMYNIVLYSIIQERNTTLNIKHSIYSRQCWLQNDMQTNITMYMYDTAIDFYTVT